MTAAVIQHPSGILTSVGTSVRVRMLPRGSRSLPVWTITAVTPVAQTLTTTAAAIAGATTLAVAALAVPILAGTSLTFGATTVTVVADVDRGALAIPIAPAPAAIASAATATYTPPANAIGNSQLFVAPIPTAIDAGERLTYGAQTVIVTRAAVQSSIVLFVAPLTAAVANNTSATTRALFEVVGATDASPQSSPNAVDAADYQSGAGAEMAPISTNRTLNFAFNRKLGSRGAAILMYMLYDDAYFDREVYAFIRRASGETFEGAAVATSGDGSAAKQSLITQNCNLQFQGSSFIWTPATADNLVAQNIITP